MAIVAGETATQGSGSRLPVAGAVSQKPLKTSPLSSMIKNGTRYIRVRLLILPNLETYLQLLEPEMLLEKQKNEMKRHEAWRVYGALLRAAGRCVYDRLKMFPPLPSPTANSVWKTNGRVATMRPNKRKANMEHLEHQPPIKKVAADGPLVSLSNNSVASEMQEGTRVPASLPESGAGPSSSSTQISSERISGGRGGREKQALKMSAVLAQAWKDDLNSGHLLVSLFEQFGERIFSFIPTPEMSLFL